MSNESTLETELLTVSEIAAALKVPVSWVYERTRRSGTEQIPHIKLGKYLRFRWSAVRQWLDALAKN
jgi:excisionase family DNA binding protein